MQVGMTLTQPNSLKPLTGSVQTVRKIRLFCCTNRGLAMNQTKTPIILNEAEQTAVHNFLQKLHQRYGETILQTILFGSKARGESGPD